MTPLKKIQEQESTGILANLVSLKLFDSANTLIALYSIVALIFCILGWGLKY